MTQPENKIDLKELQGALIDHPDFLKDVIRRALQKIVEAQFETHIGASRYERTDRREGYRNGFYER